MTELCTTKGSTVYPCESLLELIKGNVAGFKYKTFRNFDTNQSRVAVAIEKSSKNWLEIFYCPACGGNIETRYLEKTSHSPDAKAAEQGYYIQDMRKATNMMKFWKQLGYTSNISDAFVFPTLETAIHAIGGRGSDRIWPKTYIDSKAILAVDSQDIDISHGMNWTQANASLGKNHD